MLRNLKIQIAFAILACYATSVLGSCEPTWPLTLPCSGNGECINNTCVCYEPWTGRHDWLGAEGNDCITHKTTRTVMGWIGWIGQMLALCYAGYAIFRIRPIVIFRARKDVPRNYFRKIDPQILLLLVTLNLFFGTSSSTGALWLDVYIQESVALTVLFSCMAIGQLLIATAYAYLWIQLAIRTSRMSRNKILIRVTRWMKWFLFSQFGIAGGLIFACALGAAIVGAHPSQIIMVRVGMLGSAIATYIEWLTFLFFSFYISRQLATHLKSNVALRDDRLRTALAMIKRVQFRMSLIIVIVATFEFICGIVMILTAYVAQMVFIMSAISYALRIKSDILSAAEAESTDSTATTLSGNRSGISINSMSTKPSDSTASRDTASAN